MYCSQFLLQYLHYDNDKVFYKNINNFLIEILSILQSELKMRQY